MSAHSRTRALTLAVSLSVAGTLLGAPPARDWKAHPAIVQYDTTEDIYAVGDAHSDYEHLDRVLHAAGIVKEITDDPAAAQWSAGHSILVSTGDMVDKGPRALDVLRFYRSLREKAAAAGGRVIILAGNHEIEFLADPAAPKGKDFAGQLKAAHIDPASIAACTGEFGEFICSLAIGARVNNWYFSHAGFTGGRSLKALESEIETAYAKDGYAAKLLIDENSLLRAGLDRTPSQIDSPAHTPWPDWGMPAKDEVQLLTSYTSALGVQHIVEGHQATGVLFADNVKRNSGEMFQRYGLLFLIDTGMSRGVNESDGAVLHISVKAPSSATAICADGSKTLLWDEIHHQTEGSAHACGRRWR